MNYFVYILQSISTGKYYIGQTNNLIKRLSQHNSGISSYTRFKGPFKLIYTKIFSSRSEAMRREKEIKSYKGGHSFKNLLSNESRQSGMASPQEILASAQHLMYEKTQLTTPIPDQGIQEFRAQRQEHTGEIVKGVVLGLFIAGFVTLTQHPEWFSQFSKLLFSPTNP